LYRRLRPKFHSSRPRRCSPFKPASKSIHALSRFDKLERAKDHLIILFADEGQEIIAREIRIR
jgi:hypothetical protein